MSGTGQLGLLSVVHRKGRIDRDRNVAVAVCRRWQLLPTLLLLLLLPSSDRKKCRGKKECHFDRAAGAEPTNDRSVAVARLTPAAAAAAASAGIRKGFAAECGGGKE